MKQLWFECFKKEAKRKTYITTYYWKRQNIRVPRSGMIFFCRYPDASCNIACNLRNLSFFKFLSSDEMSIPIKPPYGLFFKRKSKLISAFKHKQVAKNTEI